MFIFTEKNIDLGAVVIKSDTKNLKLITELAKRLGGDVVKLNEEQYEDFYFGEMMKEAKTGKIVSRDTIMRKLRRLSGLIVRSAKVLMK